jgi:hypothetical protein
VFVHDCTNLPDVGSLVRYFRRSARETQRLVAITASPVFALVEETLDGLLTIRAYRAQGEIVDSFSAKIKINSSFCWIKTSLDQWLLIRLCFLGTIVVSGASVACTLARFHVNPTLTGLALSYSMVRLLLCLLGARDVQCVSG